MIEYTSPVYINIRYSISKNRSPLRELRPVLFASSARVLNVPRIIGNKCCEKGPTGSTYHREQRPVFFASSVWAVNVPWIIRDECCEKGPTAYSTYPRRLDSLTVRSFPVI